jgi:hypothetical protein
MRLASYYGSGRAGGRRRGQGALARQAQHAQRVGERAQLRAAARAANSHADLDEIDVWIPARSIARLLR